MEPNPGDRFEVEWGHFGALDYSGDKRKLYAFARYAQVVGTKVCTVKGIDNRGLPKTVLVEAGSLLEVTVHEPQATFQVRPAPLIGWVSRRTDGETIGMRAMKLRIRELLRDSDAGSIESRREKRRR